MRASREAGRVLEAQSTETLRETGKDAETNKDDYRSSDVDALIQLLVKDFIERYRSTYAYTNYALALLGFYKHVTGNYIGSYAKNGIYCNACGMRLADAESHSLKTKPAERHWTACAIKVLRARFSTQLEAEVNE